MVITAKARRFAALRRCLALAPSKRTYSAGYPYTRCDAAPAGAWVARARLAERCWV